MPETSINITEKLQKIGQTAQEYKDAIVNQFKDMEVDIKDWNFSVGKADKEYNVDVNIKLAFARKKLKHKFSRKFDPLFFKFDSIISKK